MQLCIWLEKKTEKRRALKLEGRQFSEDEITRKTSWLKIWSTLGQKNTKKVQGEAKNKTKKTQGENGGKEEDFIRAWVWPCITIVLKQKNKTDQNQRTISVHFHRKKPHKSTKNGSRIIKGQFIPGNDGEKWGNRSMLATVFDTAKIFHAQCHECAVHFAAWIEFYFRSHRKTVEFWTTKKRGRKKWKKNLEEKKGKKNVEKKEENWKKKEKKDRCTFVWRWGPEKPPVPIRVDGRNTPKQMFAGREFEKSWEKFVGKKCKRKLQMRFRK